MDINLQLILKNHTAGFHCRIIVYVRLSFGLKMPMLLTFCSSDMRRGIAVTFCSHGVLTEQDFMLEQMFCT